MSRYHGLQKCSIYDTLFSFQYSFVSGCTTVGAEAESLLNDHVIIYVPNKRMERLKIYQGGWSHGSLKYYLNNYKSIFIKCR